MSPSSRTHSENKEVLSDSATATTTTNAPFTSMVSPPSTGSNSGSDLEDLGLGDSATANKEVLSDSATATTTTNNSYVFSTYSAISNLKICI